MTPEEIKAKADADAAEEAKKKADADSGTKLDKLLAGMDSLTSRMDSFEANEKKKADADEKAKADAEAKIKADAEEAEKKKGDPEQTAADKAKKDAEEAEAKKKADQEEDDKKKADAQTELSKRIDAVAAMIPKGRSDADHAAMADCQARADNVFHGFGERAPRPLDGETLNGYRIRLATKLKVHSPMWKGIELAGMADDAFANIETQVYADAENAARNPVDLPDGVLREIVRTDPSTGMRTITFTGNGTFIGASKRPARVITGIGVARSN